LLFGRDKLASEAAPLHDAGGQIRTDRMARTVE
jgi:hypothetical protein